MSQPLPIAGWYPDPEFAGHDRWGDGLGWSDSRRASADAGAPGAVGAVAMVAPASPAPAYVPAPRGRNTLALVGLILSLTGIVLPLIVNSFAGGIVSAVALRRSTKQARTGAVATGRSLSIAGVLVGFIWGGLCLLFVVSWIAFVLWIVVSTNDVPLPGSPA